MNGLMPQDQIIKGKFIFLSYSHHEKEMVQNDVLDLHKRSVRVWFDDNLEPSDEWSAVAKSIIEHENCIGVLFYNSEYSFASAACNEERKYTLERRERDPAFKYWFLNVNDEKTDSLVAKAFSIAMSKGFANFIKNVSDYISPLFEENIIRINCAGNGHRDEIYRLAQENYVVDNEFNALKAMDANHLVDRGTGLIQFGCFTGAKCETPVPHDGDNERFVREGKQYVAFGNEVYFSRVLNWKLLYVKDSVAVLLCDSIVATKCGGKSADDFLEQEFFRIAFSEEEKAMLIAPPRLPDENDIENAGGVGAFGSTEESVASAAHYWIKKDGMLPDWQCTVFRNVLYGKGFVVSVKKGIRPVIGIPVEKLNALKR